MKRSEGPELEHWAFLLIGIHRHSHGAGGSRYLQGPSGSNLRRHSKLEEGFHLLEKPSWSLLQPLFITLKNLKNPRLQPQKGHINGREHCAASIHTGTARRCAAGVAKPSFQMKEMNFQKDVPWNTCKIIPPKGLERCRIPNLGQRHPLGRKEKCI